MTSVEIDLPIPSTTTSIRRSLELFSSMLTDGILWLGYGIAILSILKFIISQVNGYRAESHLGASALGDSSFFSGASRLQIPSPPPPRRTPFMVQSTKQPSILPPVSSM